MGAPILSGFLDWGGCTHTLGVWTGVGAPILNGGWAEVGAPKLSGCMGGLGCSAKHCKKGQDVSTVAMCPIKEV